MEKYREHSQHGSHIRGVTRVVMVAEDTKTNAPHHRSVTPHQRFEGRSLSAAHKALQKLSVGQIRSIP